MKHSPGLKVSLNWFPLININLLFLRSTQEGRTSRVKVAAVSARLEPHTPLRWRETRFGWRKGILVSLLLFGKDGGRCCEEKHAVKSSTSFWRYAMTPQSVCPAGDISGCVRCPPVLLGGKMCQSLESWVFVVILNERCFFVNRGYGPQQVDLGVVCGRGEAS